MRWLPRHAGLVSDLTISNPSEDPDLAATTFELLEQALRLYAQHTAQSAKTTPTALPAAAADTSRSCSSSGVSVASSGDILQSAAPLPLCLRSFIAAESQTPVSVLQLLQSAGLQRLEITVDPYGMPAGLWPVIADMQLEHLVLELGYLKPLDDEHTYQKYPTPLKAASAVGQLTALTFLKITGMTPVGARHLPQSLQQLVLEGTNKDTSTDSSSSSPETHCISAGSDLMSLTHLTALSSLLWHSEPCGGDHEVPDLALPLQPLELNAEGQLQLVGPHNLSRATILPSWRGRPAHNDLDVLLQLPSHPHTQSLDLNLCCLYEVSPENGGFQKICTALGGLTNLTSLVYRGTELWASNKLYNVQLLQHLSKLPLLVDVELFVNMPVVDESVVDAEPSSMLQLSALTSLTRLSVDVCDLDDVAATAVAVNLTRLQQLDLSSGMLNYAALPAIAQLTGLRSLVLHPHNKAPELTSADLQQLAALTLLTQLHLPCAQPSEADKQQFLACMPSLIRHWLGSR
jgi:hypothetical protein